MNLKEKKKKKEWKVWERKKIREMEWGWRGQGALCTTVYEYSIFVMRI